MYWEYQLGRTVVSGNFQSTRTRSMRGRATHISSEGYAQKTSRAPLSVAKIRSCAKVHAKKKNYERNLQWTSMLESYFCRTRSSGHKIEAEPQRNEVSKAKESEIEKNHAFRHNESLAKEEGGGAVPKLVAKSSRPSWATAQHVVTACLDFL